MKTLEKPDNLSLAARAKACALARVGELALLEDGWLDGEAVAPRPEALQSLLRLIARQPVLFLHSGIFPTFEGGILIEESLGPYEAEILIGPGGNVDASWDGEDLDGPEELEKRLFETQSLHIGDPEILFELDDPIVIRCETELGWIYGFALPEEEMRDFVGILPGTEIWRSFLRGKCCLREVHLDPSTRIFLFDVGDPLQPVLDIVKEAWLPNAGLMVRDLPLKRPFA